MFSSIPKKVKGIITVVSAILTHFMLGNLFTFGSINKYYASFLHMKNPKYDQNDAYFMLPTGSLAMHFTSLLGAYLETKFGTRFIIFLSSLLIIISLVIICFVYKLGFILVAFALYGFADGLTYFAVIKNCWKYFPDKKGFLSGFIMAVAGLTPSIFTAIADAIINPGKVNIEESGYFNETISKRVQKYFLVLLICIAALAVLSILLSFPYEETEEEKNLNIAKNEITENKEDQANKIDNETEIKEDGENEVIIDSKENNVESNDSENRDSKPILGNIRNSTDTNKNEEPDLKLKYVIKSKQFILLTVFCYGMNFYTFFIQNTYRTFGSEAKIGEDWLQVLSKVLFVIISISRIAIGFVYDKLGFFVTYLILLVSELICSVAYYYTKSVKILFCIVTCLSMVSYGGHGAVFPALFAQIFGVNKSVHILGMLHLFVSSSSILGPIICKFARREGHIEDYLPIYLTGSGFTLISLITFFFIKEEKFDPEKARKLSENDLEKLKEKEKEEDKGKERLLELKMKT